MDTGGPFEASVVRATDQPDRNDAGRPAQREAQLIDPAGQSDDGRSTDESLP